MATGSGKHHESGRLQFSGGSGSRGGDNGGTGIGLQQLLLTAVAFILVPSILFAVHNLNHISTFQARPASVRRLRLSSSSPKVHFAVQLAPNYEILDGTEFVWQIPPVTEGGKKLKGIVLFAHGCYGRSTSFWDRHPRCGNCSGMPEERLLTLHALSRGYAVIAVSSTAECWKSSVDVKKVVKVMNMWTKRHGLDQLPVVALGASSGGFFVSVLATEFKLQSLVVEISHGKFGSMEIDSTYPPTLFVHMPKDRKLSAKVKESMGILRLKGVETEELLCDELKVTPFFFSDKIPELDEVMSIKLVEALKDYGLINDSNYMKMDGRSSSWLLPVRKRNVLSFDLRTRLERHVEEELNLAFAFHEMTSVPAESIFDWFDSHGDSSPLVETM